VEKEEYNKDVPEGFVISQDPFYMEKYNKVKQGSTVKVVISKGQEKTKVPNVKGKEKEEAIKLLEEAKLKVEVIEETSKTVKEGYVISQEIDPDTEAFAGDTVKIHVSTGTEKSTVPDVIGKTQSDAKKSLESLGFVVTIATTEDSSKDTGIVLKQSIDSGKSVDKGSSITITINSYEASKTMNVSINVKSITGGYTEENGNSTSGATSSTAKTVSITLKSGGTTLYSDSGVDKNTTSKSASISGKGSMDLTLTITDSNGGSWTRTKTVNFNNDTSVSF
ncbi:MAG: PASTA domain-containing protein, partial [Clostridia bacterium]|nr:PASTA domain-containing protein [Clostridia bacterium]